ncbi:MAG: ABC transporter permease [Rhodospirillales bacterium]|jgi:peptide/nickel transport system permease protein
MTAPAEGGAGPRGLFGRMRLPGGARLGPVQLWVGAVLVAAMAVAAVWFALDPPPGAYRGSLVRRFRAPGVDGFFLGTDQLGRSLLLRLAAGLPWSIGIATVATAIAMALGTAAGLAAAVLPGWPRTVVRLTVDTVIAFPGLVIAVTVIALVGRGFWPVAITLGVTVWTLVARVVFAEAQGVMRRDYVTAAQFLGVSPAMVLWTHVLPALRPTLLVMAAFVFADMLIIESALSLLGLGAPLTAPTWGNMLSESRQFMANAPWMMMVPGSAIVLAVVSLNLLGDGIAQRARARARAIEL